MTVDLMAYRRNLCRAMAGLVDEEWYMVVRLINRIDRASKATVRFVITAQLEELMEAADFFEELAGQIRRARK